MKPWRIPAIVVLLVLVAAGVVVENRSDAPEAPAPRLGELMPTAAAPGTPSSTWYCAAGTATGVTSGADAGIAEQVVTVANDSDAAVTGTLTAVADDGRRAAAALDVPAHGRQQVRVSDVIKAAWASALVETSAGQVAVAHELTGPSGRTVTPCASTPGANWYFPAGTTRDGATNFIALFNPFPGAATVDVAFDTDAGARTPRDFQGIAVEGGRVLVIDVSSVVTLREHIATTVSVRTGRIVAEQIQTAAGSGDLEQGLTSVVGASTPSPLWTFPVATPAGSAAREEVSVFNPSDTDTLVQIEVQLDDPDVNGTVEPFEFTVPPHRYVTTDLFEDSRVPTGVGHWLIVRSTDSTDIVVERSIGGARSSDAGGLTYSMGIPVVATRWLVPVATTGDVATSQLAVANPSATETATVTVKVHGAGTLTDAEGATALIVAPGERVLVDLLQPAFQVAGATVEVDADVGVAVGQWVAFASVEDVASPDGVPVNGTQSLPVDVITPEDVIDQGLTEDTLPDVSIEENGTSATDPTATDPSGADAAPTTTAP